MIIFTKKKTGSPVGDTGILTRFWIFVKWSGDQGTEGRVFEKTTHCFCWF